MNHFRHLTILLVLLISASNFRNQFLEMNHSLIHILSLHAILQTGEMGVAVQSHWFSVGSIVAWGEAGVGVVATQSFVNPSFGQRGLELLKKGMTAQEAVDLLIQLMKEEILDNLQL